MARRLVLLAATAALLAGCSIGAGGSADDGTGFVSGDGSIVVLDGSQRRPAPDITGPTLDGGTYSLAAERGKVVIMNVWASWCAPCRAEAPALERTWTEFRARPVSFVGLNTRDSMASADGYVRQFGITYPSIVDTDGRIQLLFRDTLPPQAIPSTVVIDQEGRVAARILGEVTESSLRGVIDSLLAESPPPSP